MPHLPPVMWLQKPGLWVLLTPDCCPPAPPCSDWIFTWLGWTARTLELIWTSPLPTPWIYSYHSSSTARALYMLH